MKNKKGFVLSTYVYILLVFFLLLLGTMLAVLNNTRLLSVKLKEQASNTTGLIDKDFSFILIGDKEIIIRLGEEFIDPGYKIQSSKGVDLSENVIVDGTVNSNAIGTYTIYYRSSYNGVTKELVRKVHVLDDIAVNYINGVYTYKPNENGLAKDSTSDKNIRYSGSDNAVKNYVTFNDELWRIVGVFNVSNGTTTAKRVKLIRNSSLGDMSWDSSESTINYGNGVNEWSQADIQTMLNTYYIGTSTTCTYCNDRNQSTCTNDCSSTVKPISGTYINMIEDVVWNTGTLVWGADGVSVETAYEEERGTIGKICGGGSYCNDTVARTTTWKGKVGLIYPSDYGYASTYAGCHANIRNVGAMPCKNSNWLYDHYWTLSPSSESYDSDLATDASIVWDAQGSYVFNSAAYNADGVRPAVYLKSNVKITDGNGTKENPYKLSL